MSVQVFVRHCHFSDVSVHKKRFANYSTKKCFDNLIATGGDAKISFFLDTFYPMEKAHFLTQEKRFPVMYLSAGTEALSFLRVLEHVASLDLPSETIIYFLEDDYMHREGWLDVLKEGLSIPGIHYATLYDHKDKYFTPAYAHLESKIFHTASCHWRTTPSTTNTYAMYYGTLMEDFEIHRAFSLGRKISADHDKFCALAKKGRILISSIPGFATHAEPEYASPCYNWDALFTE